MFTDPIGNDNAINNLRDTLDAQLAPLKGDVGILEKDLDKTKEEFSKTREVANEVFQSVRKLRDDVADMVKRFANEEAADLLPKKSDWKFTACIVALCVFVLAAIIAVVALAIIL